VHFPTQTFKRTAVQMPMTALIDIVFLLLIYFLLTTNFLTTDSLSLDLPRSESAVAQQAGVMTISMNQNGDVFIGGIQIADNDLIAHLKTEMIKKETRSLVIRSDRRVSLERVVTVLDIVRITGIQQVSLATSR
jgi:biopolymer transport protein ExbD